MKNVTELMEILSNELDKCGKEGINPATANATANLVGKYAGLIKIILEASKMAGKTPDLKNIIPSLDAPVKKLTVK